MLGQPWWYALVFWLAVLCWIGVPVAAWFERRADQRDAETWSEIPGATR